MTRNKKQVKRSLETRIERTILIVFKLVSTNIYISLRKSVDKWTSKFDKNDFIHSFNLRFVIIFKARKKMKRTRSWYSSSRDEKEAKWWYLSWSIFMKWTKTHCWRQICQKLISFVFEHVLYFIDIQKKTKNLPDDDDDDGGVVCFFELDIEEEELLLYESE